MTQYKLYKGNGIWRAIVAVGSGATITVIASNFQWLLKILSTVFGIK